MLLIFYPHVPSPPDHSVIICRCGTEAAVVFKAPWVIPTCSWGWWLLTCLFSLCPWEHRTYVTSVTSPIHFLALINFIFIYWTSIFCQAMSYMLEINSEQVKKCNWGNLSMLMQLNVLCTLPTFCPGCLIPPVWTSGPLAAWPLAPASLSWHHPPSSQDPWKTPLLLLWISLEYSENLLIHHSLHQKKENLGFGHFSPHLLASFSPHSASFPSWVESHLWFLSLWNVFL